ncbi:PREDICTED: transcription factor bHLH130-like isoform X2 [Tarenaya hassleriana]|nr:PREDICTED: transcription factor bHLH130-like isoform X2 [Tarenaya hassleriana]XP_010547249.1 PREDICTED: transcription factor bHLH130-like isoform X2 [Tarenaya hassleriana]
MSLVYGNNFTHPEAEFIKNEDFMDPYFPNQQQEQLIRTNGAARYRSTPSPFFNNSFENGGNYRSFRSPSPEMDSFFADVMKTHENKEPITHQNNDLLGLQNSGNCHSSVNGSFSFMNNGSSNGSCLMKQHSSPPGLLSDLMIENEFKNSNNSHNHMNMKYRPPVSGSSIMPPHVSDLGSDFSSDSWNKNTSSDVFKGIGGMDITFSGSETQNGSSRNKLAHHLSLPTTFSEKDSVEKFLHFQGTSVPCKVRAKRGFATHPRSIAERVRRNRISQKMKKLQDLFPDMDKQTSTADMLDMAVDQIKELEKQVKALNYSRAKCRCSGKN